MHGIFRLMRIDHPSAAPSVSVMDGEAFVEKIARQRQADATPDTQHISYQER
jgi:hypothetical protein